MKVTTITALPLAANMPSRKLLERNNFTIDHSGNTWERFMKDRRIM